MTWFILGASILAAIVLAGSFLANAPPKSLARALKWVGIGGAVLIAASLLVTGRAVLLLPLILFGLPVLRRWLGGGGWRFPSLGSAPSPGGTSDVETATLRMVLDHDSGTVDGTVIGGGFAGRGLGTLALADLLALLAECGRDDPESGPLVEAYLDRAHPAWRTDAGEAAGAAGGRGAYDTPMDVKEARGILELEAGAGEADIKAAHHRLMKKLHPDQGGSTYLASKINQAKDVLLGS